MSKYYIAVLAIAAFWVSAVGATFSVIGLTQLFAGASAAVAIMASALEFSKLVTAGFLYRYWAHIGRTMRLYLGVALVVLVSITSLGIFGFLSAAYQKSSLSLNNYELRMSSLQSEEARFRDEINETQKIIDSIPASRISTRLKFQREANERFKELRERIEMTQQEMAFLKSEILETHSKIGPMIYVAEVFGVNVDTVAKFLIFLFVSVFDPLAICLVFATSLAIRLKEKYKGREHKIGELAWNSPVDHRFKKSA